MSLVIYKGILGKIPEFFGAEVWPASHTSWPLGQPRAQIVLVFSQWNPTVVSLLFT
jgi:hypothetical protein